ncbi:hypothetical protein EV132_13242 [Rhizobium sullae]|uniref:Uncharacterized protein n=1 Tax=Rhizobium sullae TaxID=50338 RepID=A0A4R3PWE8_RHISU|nr:hypothetical protein EV132_13242 [Rhizobium sullae]
MKPAPLGMIAPALPVCFGQTEETSTTDQPADQALLAKVTAECGNNRSGPADMQENAEAADVKLRSGPMRKSPGG